MDDDKCIEFLNLGISEKRNGNYEKALLYYEKAKEYNPQNSNIYYNSAKLLTGIAKYDAAIRNFLTYAHFTVMNDAFFKNPLNSLTKIDVLERIRKSNLQLPPNMSFSSDWLIRLNNNKRLSSLLADINLTFYTGFSFLADHPDYLKFYLIDDSMIQDLQNVLLGKHSNGFLKNSKYEIFIISYGLILLIENLKTELTSLDGIANYYIDKNFIIKSPLRENKIAFDGFLDRNPEDKELDNFLTQVQRNIKKELSLNSVYMGYNLLTEKIFDDLGMAIMGSANIGHTATIGFERDMLEELLSRKSSVYLCYIALPIDEDDYLVEKEEMLDWDFEKYLANKYQANIVTVGALSKGDHKRCRTFKFIYEKK